MKKWWHKLHQPYPMTDGTSGMWQTALVGGGFVTFFLYVFRPFGMHAAEEGDVFQLSLEFGLITAVVAFIWEGITRLFPFVFREERWTVLKEVEATLLFVCMVGAANFLYGSWRYGTPLNGVLFWRWQQVTFLVGMFPTFYGVISKEMRLLKQFGQEAAQLNAHLHEAHPPDQSPDILVELTGDNQNERLSVSANALLYLCAADNYVQVFYLGNGMVKQTLLRGALKKMEDLLAVHPQFYRCHRTYIVNLDRVYKVSGNAQGYKLHVEGVEEMIPVSRSLNDGIREKLG